MGNTDITECFANNKIPIVKYQLECVVDTTIKLPKYAGSALRGIFGYGLLKLRVNDFMAAQMNDIDLYNLCPYRMIFDPPKLDNPIYGLNNIPVPYVINPDVSLKKQYYNCNDLLKFELVLIGNAIQKLSYVINAFKYALSNGIGAKNQDGNRGVATLQTVAVKQKIIWDNQQQIITPYDEFILTDNFQDSDTINIAINTPMRLQKGKKICVCNQDIDAEIILISSVRRVASLLTIHTNVPIDIDFTKLRQLAKQIKCVADVKTNKLTRYSNRQQQKIDLVGIVGNVLLTGNLTPFIPYLHLAQYTNIGKNASLGLGNIKLN